MNAKYALSYWGKGRTKKKIQINLEMMNCGSFVDSRENKGVNKEMEKQGN